MYVLQRGDFRVVDPVRVVQFVECWERYYRGDIRLPNSDEVIDYFAELNLGHELSERNLIRLLRWKDQRMLTHPMHASSGGQNPNPRVARVLREIQSINRFRKADVSDLDFKNVTQSVFPNGIIWQLFLFHIARPWEWPIADQHVFRSYSVLYSAAAPVNIDTFHTYVRSFNDLADMFRYCLGVNNNDLANVVKANKRLDNALMAFGQFLGTYDR